MHTMKEIHNGIGETGHFGEFFFLLGALILVGATGLMIVGATEVLQGDEASASDAILSGVLFALLGSGLTGFGIVNMYNGWTNHHPESEDRLPGNHL